MLERTDKIAINVSVLLLLEAAGTLHAVLIVIFMMHRIIGIDLFQIIIQNPSQNSNYAVERSGNDGYIPPVSIESSS